MFNLFRKDRAAFGFDISDVSVKVMQLEKKSKSHKVTAYTDYQLPKGIVVNDIVMDKKTLAIHLKNALKKMDFGAVSTKQIVASIPESKAFVRVIEIPKMSEDQAVSAVPIEAEAYIPIPLDQAYFDWEIFAEREEKLEVLVTASPKDYVDSYLAVLKEAGLQPVAFEVESAAVTRALLSASQKDKDFLILDMNTYRTSLIVISKGHLQFTSSVPIAGDAFTQAIARALAVPEAQAEKIKRENGINDAKENQAVKVALQPVVDNLVTEVRNILKFHAEHDGAGINQIMLCGGTSKLLGLCDYLQKKLSSAEAPVDVAQGDPWINLADPKGSPLSALSKIGSLSYTTAIGLAMRGAEN